MFLSIIIPVYNAEKYLAECLDSCLNQDIPHEDYEIICVNDGSKDGSAAILDSYAAKYPNVHVVHKANAGVSEARNDGFTLARGTYIWFVDNDDFIHPNALPALQQHIAIHPCEKLIFPYYEFTEVLTEEEIAALQNGTLPANSTLCNSVVWAYLIRKDFLEKHNLLHRSCDSNGFPLYGYGVDNLFVYQCNKYLSDVDTISAFPFYFYRQNSASVTKDVSPQAQIARIREYTRLAAYMTEEYSSLPADSIHKTSAADLCMVFLRRSTFLTAQLPYPSFRTSLQELKAKHLFPMRQLPECTFSCRQFIEEQNGMTKLQNILRFHSITLPGMFALATIYRLQRMKIRLSRFLRKNPLTKWLLDMKNKLLRR